MKQTITNLRKQPDEVKVRIAFGGGLVITALIVAGYVALVTSHPKDRSRQQAANQMAPSPIDALSDSFSDMKSEMPTFPGMITTTTDTPDDSGYTPTAQSDIGGYYGDEAVYTEVDSQAAPQSGAANSTQSTSTVY